MLPHFLHATVAAAVHQADEHSSCTGSCLRNWKIIFCVILFVEGLVFAHFAYLVRKVTAKSRRAFDISAHFGHALSAGVFFAAGLLHILPEAVENLSSPEGEDPHEEEGHNDKKEHHGEEGHSMSFPWAYFVMMLGFYVFFFIEKILLPKLFGESFHVHRMENKPGLADVDPSSASGAEESYASKDRPTSPVDDMDKSANTSTVETRFLSVTFIIALLQIMGLSAHSLFESMALGLSSEFGTVLNVFIATASHRWVTAVAIGFTVASKLSYKLFVVIFVIFCAMVPLGIGIGAALDGLSSQARGVLFSLSAATFLYIGVFETMADEFVVHREMLARKFLATIAGAAVITVITVILISTKVHHG